MENAEIAAVFEEIADVLEIQGENPFRVRSYRNAARTLRDLSERVVDLVDQQKDLSKLPNVGESISRQIHQILKRGTSKRLESLRKKVPEELPELMRVPGLGPKKVKLIYDALGVHTLGELKEAAESGRLRELEGMGEKTEEKILRGVETVQRHGGRVRLKEAAEYARTLGHHLDEIADLKRWELAGSLRRRKETIGDLDILVETDHPRRFGNQIGKDDLVAEVVSKGEDKIQVRLRNGLNVDFRMFERKQFGSALMYFTGSKAHNIALRKRAQKRGWKLNEYGLFNGKKRLAGKTEEEVYKKLGLAWVPPELREERGEVKAAEKSRLPQLVELDDIHGDLHAHTKATDGKNTIEEMAKGARERGYEYLAITDHSKAVTVAKGLDEDRLRKHSDDVRNVGQSIKNFALLAGVEVDILKNGDLDLDEDVLAELDWVNGAVHSHFDLSKKRMTERLLAAIRSGVVDCLAHPFGRMFGSREPIQFDIDRVFEACRDHDVCLEINAYPDRLDLPDIYCQRAKEAGVDIVISTDAHKVSDLDFMRYGVSVARRGWLEKRDIVNTTTRRSLRKRRS